MLNKYQFTEIKRSVIILRLLELAMPRYRVNRPPALASMACFPISDHVIFSRELFFYLSKNYSFIYTGLFKNLKARFLKSIITLSEIGQQTVQAKEIYWIKLLNLL